MDHIANQRSVFLVKEISVSAYDLKVYGENKSSYKYLYIYIIFP